MEHKLSGQITAIQEPVTGTSKAGKDWTKTILVVDTGEQYDPLVAFTVFGQEKVDRLKSHNKVGDKVTVTFNIKCREWEGRYFTDLSAWKIDRIETKQQTESAEVKENDLPW